MNFNDALNALKAGENVVRTVWSEADGYITLMDGMAHAWKILTQPAPNAGNHIFSVEELAAEDWQVKPKGSVQKTEAPAEVPAA